MVDFKCDITSNLVVTSATHYTKLASVGVTVRIALVH